MTSELATQLPPSPSHQVNVTTGIISTIVGKASHGDSSSDDGENGGLETDAELSSPHGLAFDAVGNLFIADTGNCIVRKVSEEITLTSWCPHL